MLTPPDIAHDTIKQRLSQVYGLDTARIEFLPLGAATGSAAFRVEATDGTAFFLKLRKGGVDPSVLAAAAFLHHDRGIAPVLAPLPTKTQELKLQADGFDWTLHPFLDGANGFERALTRPQWVALGKALGAVHRTQLPESLSASLPKEHYAHHWREGVRRYQRRFVNGVAGDDIVKRFFAFWEEHAEDIDTVVYRSEQLASILLERPPQWVPCHAELHAGNVLVGNDDRLGIVDWHTLILAPKERDLMFIGGGVGHAWNRPEEAAWFHEGYGPADLDAVAIAYYRYERIAKDIVETCDLMFDAGASVEDREEALRQMKNQFAPDDVAAIAHRSYDAVT